MLVLRKLEGATPSQRNDFRAKEKVRLEDFVSGGGVKKMAPSIGSVEKLNGVNTEGLGGRFVIVGRGGKQWVRNGQVTLGRGRGVMSTEC